MKKALAVCLLYVLLAVTSAGAQEHPDARNTAIDATPYRLAPGNRGALSVDTANVLRHLDLAVSAHGRLERRPLGVVDEDSGRWLRSLVDYRDSLDIQIALGLFGRGEIAFGLPLVLAQDAILPGKGLGAVDAQGVGDLEIRGKVVFLDSPGGVQVAVEAPLTVPTGKENAWMGHRGLTASPAALVSRTVGDTTATFRLTYRYAEDEQIFNVRDGQSLSPGFGVRTALTSLLPQLSIAAEGVGTLPLSSGIASDPYLGASWGAGLYYTSRRGYQVGVSGGGSLTATARSPGARVCISFGYTHAFGVHPPDCSYVGAYLDDPRCPADDTDGDGIPDPQDACRENPEDVDGFEDADGCPDPDNDKDGLPDETDNCPDDAEDVDGYQDEDGCPDLDNDSDGIPDTVDQCPLEPETTNGLDDEDGCPEADRDTDGILDDQDKCPDAAEDADGFEDDDGCPDLDNDADGIPDSDDLCPMRPENLNGHRDEDGCPDEVLAVKTQKEIAITEEIYFLLGQVVPRRRSRKVLKAVVAVLQRHPDIHVRIEGHTDNYGGEDFNYFLSQARAQAIRDYLVRLGRPQDRLTERLQALGLGKQAPSGTNQTKEGRAMNRRVRFVIVDAPTGSRN